MQCGFTTVKSKSNFFTNPTYYIKQNSEWRNFEGSKVDGWENHSVKCESRKTSIICNHNGYKDGKLMTSKEVVDFKRESFYDI